MIIKLDKKLIYGIIILAACVMSLLVLKTSLLFILVAYVLMFYFVCRRNESTIVYFIMCCLFQNIILIVFANSFNTFSTTLVMLIKEILLYINVILNVVLVRLKQGKIKKIDLIAFAFLLLNIFSYVFRTDIQLKYQLVASRQLFIPFVCYYLGETLKLDSEGIRHFNKIILIFTGILCIVGLFMYLYSPSDLWTNLGYKTFNYNKSGSTYTSFENFYTYDFGFKLQRFISFTADPLATVHFLMFGLIIAVEFYKKRLAEVKIIIGICIVLVVSKSILIALACYIFVKYYTSLKYKSNKYFFKLLVAMGAVCFLIYMSMGYMNNITENTATGNHFSSFLYGLQNMSLFGKGLGTAGYNLTVNAASIDGFDNGYTESFFAVIMAQLGLIGVLLFYGFLGYIIVSCYKKYNRSREQVYLVSLILMFLMVVESLFSSSSITLIGTGIYFTYAGLADRT